MKATFNHDRTRLTITVNEAEREELRNIPSGDEQGCGAIIHTDDAMHDFLEPIVCNSELEWVDPADTGDLTSAPMLGIYTREDSTLADGSNLMLCPVTDRWAVMDYQVRSVLEDLRDKGEAVFVGGAL